MTIPFVKMHGTGNDFVIIDCRCRAELYAGFNAEKIANRKTGIGCDQVIVLRASNVATAVMLIYNADGSVAETCGNAARCVVHHLLTTTTTCEIGGGNRATLELVNGRVIEGERCSGDGRIEINMGNPMYEWYEIPLREKCDTLNLPLRIGGLNAPSAVNVGNPHVTFFVDNVDAVEFDELAPRVENHTLFPDRVNVSVASVVKDDEINARVWERGVGITDSCGSAACAILVSAIRKGYVKGAEAAVSLPGGKLRIRLSGRNVFQAGDVTCVYKGEYFV